MNFDKVARYLSSGIRLGRLFDGVARTDPGVANGAKLSDESRRDLTAKEAFTGVEGQKLLSPERPGVEGMTRELSGKVQVQRPSPV